MYRHILVPLENSSYDAAILDHVRTLATLCNARVTLMHVADGFAARNIQSLKLRESEEMRADRAYLDQCVAGLAGAALDVDSVLASGDPAHEICEAAAREACDLIAMATHGHGFLNDVVRGSVANAVRHRSLVPVLLVRGMPAATTTRRTPR
ncbi:MAG: universal stress protein [Gemmatimonadaceae bacterium]|nr:universal stress protein [Gemmatimonadaceae bacterium]